jgi:hypothetical protein
MIELGTFWTCAILGFFSAIFIFAYFLDQYKLHKTAAIFLVIFVVVGCYTKAYMIEEEKQVPKETATEIKPVPQDDSKSSTNAQITVTVEEGSQ